MGRLCNDTGIGDLEDASSCSGYITFHLKYYWNGIGAHFSGWLSDLLMPYSGEESIRYALSISVALNGWSAIHFLLGAKYLRQDLEDTERQNLEGDQVSA